MSENGNGDNGLRLVEPIHPWRWRLLTVWVMGFTLVTAWGFHLINNRAHENSRSRTALCTLRQDQQVQVDNLRKYAADVEAGRRPRIAGVSDADITQSIRRTQAVIDSLEVLHCDQPA
jgi:hypothetical protein